MTRQRVQHTCVEKIEVAADEDVYATTIDTWARNTGILRGVATPKRR
jgi:hypothetical protein